MSKVVIQGNASGTGNFTIAAPNSNTDRTFNLPDEAGTIVTTAGVPASALPSGSVLQVVQTVKTDTFSTSSTTYVDITGLSASITPSSSSSKILVTATLGHIANEDAAYAILLRDSTQLLDAAAGGISVFAGGYSGGASTGESYYSVIPRTNTCLDSPNTTSSVTYKMQTKTSTGSYPIYINRGVNDGSQYQVRNVSTITLMEIAG